MAVEEIWRENYLRVDGIRPQAVDLIGAAERRPNTFMLGASTMTSSERRSSKLFTTANSHALHSGAEALPGTKLGS